MKLQYMQVSLQKLCTCIYLHFILFRFLRKQLLIGTTSFVMCVLNISSNIQSSLVNLEWRWRLRNLRKFGRRTYNRDRWQEGHWVFGGIERVSGKSFLVEVQQRNAATLISIIQQYMW